MIYIEWEDEQLKELGINKRKLEAVIKQLSAVKERMDKMGLSVYVASGTICIIHDSRPVHDDWGNPDHDAIIADVGSGWDGGDL